MKKYKYKRFQVLFLNIIAGLYKEEHLKNPMPGMWKWITVNIAC